MIVLRYLFLGLAVCVLATLAYRIVGNPVRSVDSGGIAAEDQADQKQAAQLEEARRTVVRRMQEIPQFSAFYSRLAVAYPHVYDHVIETLATHLVQVGVLGSADNVIWDALQNLQQSQGIMAARAGPESLAAYFDARAALLDAFAPVDPKLCADFLYGTPDAAIESFSMAHHDLVATFADKELAAILDGRDHPNMVGKPTAADIDLVAARMAGRALTSDEVSVLIDGKAADPPIPDTRLCEMGRVYLSVLRGLPVESRQRIYGFTAEMLTRS